MAFREVTMLEVKEVLRRWLAGKMKKPIARATGVSRNTVRSYIQAAEDCGLEPPGDVSSLSDEQLTSVMVKLRSPPVFTTGRSCAQRLRAH